MKTYNDFIDLQELFDTPTSDIKVKANNSDFFEALFQIDDKKYDMVITGSFEYPEYNEIAFSRVGVDDGHGLTGDSDDVVFTVFSTVMMLIEKYHQKYFKSSGKSGYVFSAKGASRIRLYETFAKRMVRRLSGMKSYRKVSVVSEVEFFIEG